MQTKARHPERTDVPCGVGPRPADGTAEFDADLARASVDTAHRQSSLPLRETVPTDDHALGETEIGDRDLKTAEGE